MSGLPRELELELYAEELVERVRTERAQPDARKVALLKAAGYNAIRNAHNPASQATLDAGNHAKTMAAPVTVIVASIGG